jgi:hypothetical protein
MELLQTCGTSQSGQFECATGFSQFSSAGADGSLALRF